MMRQDSRIRARRLLRAPCVVVALAAILGAPVAFAAPVIDIGSGSPTQAEVAVEVIGIDPGGTGVLPLRLAFPGTHHLNSVPMPRLVIKEPAGLTAGAVTLQGKHHFDEFLEAEIYEGVVNVLVEVTAAPSMSGEFMIRGELTYYPCSDADLTCFEQTDPIQVRLLVEPGASAATATVEGGAEGQSSPLDGGKKTLAQRVTDAFSESIWLAYLLVFVGGILASFTPCVYPMIPITVAVIGAGSAGSKSRGFWLSLIYVLGIALTYSALGAAAAGTGAAFGSFTQTFPVLVGIGLLLGVMGTAMFGFFEIQPPAFMTRLQSKRGQGLIGVLLMGAVTGLVASPCLGPVLIALLAWIAKTGDVVKGFTLLFVFAVGMGLLLIAIGTFAGALTALPKSGNWMIRIKEFLGVVLFGVGAYYIGLALATKGFPEKATWALAAAVVLGMIGYIVYRGASRSVPGAATSAGGTLRKAIGVLLFALGAYAVAAGLSVAGVAPPWLAPKALHSADGADGGVVWSYSYESEMDRAASGGIPVMIDFYADWCVYCKKLDTDVFTDDRIINESGRFVVIKVDADKRKDLVSKHGVLGLPTIVFLGSSGAEAARIESYVKADRFLDLMKTVE
jgi:thiol:disulfide interchange protein DsbD